MWGCRCGRLLLMHSRISSLPMNCLCTGSRRGYECECGDYRKRCFCFGRYSCSYTRFTPVAAAFGGSVSALQCMCSVDRVIHYTVVTLCELTLCMTPVQAQIVRNSSKITPFSGQTRCHFFPPLGSHRASHMHPTFPLHSDLYSFQSI